MDKGELLFSFVGLYRENEKKGKLLCSFVGLYRDNGKGETTI